MILADVSTLIVDTEHKTAPYIDWGIPSIRTPNVGKGRLILDRDVKFVDEKTYTEWTRRAVPQKGDLIIAREAPVGNVAIVPDIKLCLGQRTVLVRPDVTKVDPHFLCYYLLSPSMQYKMLSSSGGATVAHLNMRDIRNLDIGNIPSLVIQKKISNILSTYDDLIENNLRRIQLLEEAARFRYKLLMERHTGENVALSSLCRNITDGTHDSPKSQADGRYLITGKHIKDGFIDFSSAYKISETDHQKIQERSRVEEGDLLYSNIGTLGNVAFTTKDADYSVKNVVIIKPAEIHISRFLYYYLTDSGTLQQFIGEASGTSQKFLSLKFFRTLKVPYVSPSEIMDFSQNVAPMMQLRENLYKQNGILTKVRDILLPRLMSGEIDVTSVAVPVEPVAESLEAV